MRPPCPLLAVLLAAAGPAAAQNPAVQSITPDIDLGPTASGETGPTTFRAAASSGAVTRTGGSGYRISNGAARSLVTISCGSDPLCAEPLVVTISSIGSPTGRMGALTNFTAHENTAVFSAPPTGANPMVIELEPIGMNASASFYVGADIPILGDDSAAAAGAASSAFTVEAVLDAPGGGSDADSGAALADVFRALTVESDSGLAFGAIVRPSSGVGTVTIDPDTGVRSLTGEGVSGIGAAPARARFSVSGEPGQTFSVSLPGSFDMTGPGVPITVTLSDDVSGVETLEPGTGGAGEAEFHVGGGFAISSATPAGSYTGSFQVTVQYE